jgi:branched-chain amino acid transport system ATP-binding protein
MGGIDRMEILSTKSLCKDFGSLNAVKSVDLNIQKGELRSIIGPNGAGKTTLFNLLTGLFAPTKGDIIYKGENIAGLLPHQIAKKGIGRSFQITSIFPELTVYENIFIPAVIHNSSKAKCDERTREILENVGLKDKGNTIAANLSHGEKRHLDIGIALTTNPELLLLDEPTAGLPPEESINTVNLIKKLRSEMGYTILLIEHKMDIVLNLSDRITVLHMGEKIAEGTPKEVQANDDVQKAYLGGFDKEFKVKTGQKGSFKEKTYEILKVEKVNTFYGESHILRDVSLNIKEGEIIALLGRNGAGKTTTLRTIMCLTPPRSGEIEFQKERIESYSTEVIANKGISLVPAERRIFANLNLRENLELPFFMKKIGSALKGSQIERVFSYFPALVARKTHKGNRLSGGEQQMLAIGRGLMGNVKLMMLDEPSQGLAPRIVQHVAEIIKEINKEGVTILLVEQNAYMALSLADRVYVIDKGTIVFEGSPEVIMSDRKLSQDLLGV